MRSRLLNILFWSVISAAFIGPGTVTTAARAGASYDMQLLWTLLFAVLACIILQESAARITILSGHSLGEAIQFFSKRYHWARSLPVLAALAIFLGTAAYQAGNLAGAVSGLHLIFPGAWKFFLLILSLLAALFLYSPSLVQLSRLLGALVAIMGLVFLYIAIRVAPDWNEVAQGLLHIRIPSEHRAPLIVLGLVGTTIVPYNLFLGSGLGEKNKNLSEMRWGLIPAILLGGIISMAVLITGQQVTGSFSFAGLSAAMYREAGMLGSYVLAFGLCTAGFTSAVTAPLAAAITFRHLFSRGDSNKWAHHSWRYRVSWAMVLFTGFVFGLLGIRPIPLIITAQALNGFLLPIMVFFMVYILNTRLIMKEKLNSPVQNGLLFLIMVITLIMGLTQIVSAMAGIFHFKLSELPYLYPGIALCSTLVSIIIMLKIHYLRRSY